ncbi:MAG: hypothetical protein ABR915_01040 [Thermoguttaceae bacterium]|jgi:hypothetical protein
MKKRPCSWLKRRLVAWAERCQQREIEWLHEETGSPMVVCAMSLRGLRHPEQSSEVLSEILIEELVFERPRILPQPLPRSAIEGPQSHEHDDALAEIANLCRDNDWKLVVWDIAAGLQLPGQGTGQKRTPQGMRPPE